MRMLQCGCCEPLKTGVHATVLGLAAVCGLYNAAAWLSRRQTHLGINAILYVLLVAWEKQHVDHHLALLDESGTEPQKAVQPVSPAVTALAA